MANSLTFDRDFDPNYGSAVDVAPGIRRLTARNSGPTTFHGTNSYILGSGQVAIVDPGPDDGRHVADLLAAVEGETVTHIILTHTHRDHTGALAALRAATGALTAGNGPHRPSRPPRDGETARLDAAGDATFHPDLLLADGTSIRCGDWQIEAIATPGHTANHLAFSLPGRDLMLSGDHVMGWSTTIVAPPDGSMHDYMRSLDKLIGRPETRYLPGHGGPIAEAHGYVRGLKRHRQMREAAILERLIEGDRTIPEIVGVLYRDVDPRLHLAAGLSVLAHLEDLVASGSVVCDGPPAIGGSYFPT
jgi:glyoxylase-like metal-dependent hydrolase (beta-lactamase superfamily II)